MNKLLTFSLMLLCCHVYAQSAGTFKSLYPLAGGIWQMKTKKGFICERWTKISPDEMQNTGFKISGVDTAVEEKVRVIKRGNDIFYVPTVTGQNGGKEVFFKLISTINGQFIFSNPEHDFPQRVVYQLIAADSLHAWIDGQYKGKFVKQDFYYKRVK